jgi:hypothetical protein
MGSRKLSGSSGASTRTCGVCNKAVKGSPHNHGVGLPLTVKDMGSVQTERPIVGTPPSR